MSKALALFLITLVAVNPCAGKDKKKSTLPEVVLRARYVVLMSDPDEGVSIMNPGENTMARRDVESAIRKWGRFTITLDARNADLVFVLRKGGAAVKPTMGGIPNEPPIAAGPMGDGAEIDVRTGRQGPSRPAMRTEVGTADDVFSVYMARGDNPLDSPPLWRYVARDALQHPTVPAVEKFRKAIEEAEKAKP